MQSIPNATPDVYRQTAINTRSRRQAAGRYATPAQKQAFAKWLSPARMRGTVSMTVAELELLATHPNLLAMQRDKFSRMAEVGNE